MKLPFTVSLWNSGLEHWTWENLKWRKFNSEIMGFRSLKYTVKGESLKLRNIKLESVSVIQHHQNH